MEPGAGSGSLVVNLHSAPPPLLSEYLGAKHHTERAGGGGGQAGRSLTRVCLIPFHLGIFCSFKIFSSSALSLTSNFFLAILFLFLNLFVHSDGLSGVKYWTCHFLCDPEKPLTLWASVFLSEKWEVTLMERGKIHLGCESLVQIGMGLANIFCHRHCYSEFIVKDKDESQSA